MGKKFAKPEIGDVFAIPLLDGDHALGQVVAVVQELGSVGCAIFPSKIRPQDPVPNLGVPISVLLVTADLLQRGYWPVIMSSPVKVSPKLFTWECFRRHLWVGTKIHGSGIVREFVDAYHGLIPWDTMADPDYFTKLLVKGAATPSCAFAAKG
jgi:hypothetical protein